MLRANKDTFEKEVGVLREQVKDFQNALREKLTGIYDDNAKRLTKALLPSVLKNPPEEWTGALGTNPEKQHVESMLHRTLLQAFGDPESLLKEMRVNLNFKGVTYGTLIDATFIKGASDQFPNLKLHEEYQAARGSAAPIPLQHETEPA